MSDGVVQAVDDEVDDPRPKRPVERHPVISLGDFPFPILDRGRESRQVVWIRNHANYMAGGGVLDYVRAVSVVIRGLLVNLLVGLPYLLLIGLGVAALNASGWRFRAMLVLLAVALLWVATAPIANRLWNAGRLNKIDALGTTSSVAIRDRFERSFGALLLLIALAAAIEGMSYLLDGFHSWTRESAGTPAALSSIGTFVLIVGAGARPLLPKLGKVAKPIALTVVGAVGLLLPVLIVMFVADFLVFTGVREEWLEVILLAGLAVIAFMVIGFVVIMLTDRRSGSIVTAGLMLVLAAGLFGLLAFGADRFLSENERTSFTDLVALDVSSNEEFIEATAASPPRELIALEELIDRQLASAAREASLVRRSAPDIGSAIDVDSPEGRRLAAALTALGTDASYFPGIVSLVDEVGADFADGVFDVVEDGTWVAAELEQLRRRILVIEPLLVERQSTQDLLNALMDIGLERPQDLIAEGQAMIALADAEDQDFSGDSEELRTAGQEIIDLANDLIEDSYTNLFAEDLYYVDLFYNPDEIFYTDAFLTFFLPVQFPTLTSSFFASDIVMSELFDVELQLVLAREQVVREAVFSSRASTIGNLEVVNRIRWASFRPAAIATVILAALAWLYSWLAIDPNRTSLNGMYRDRLAAAFLVGADTKGDIDVEVDLDLRELSRHDAGSIAPYHLINAVVNLQGSKEISIQDRSGDFFVFSKRFVGSKLTGYCRSETMERVFPEMSLSTAMAVSGAAASPNMGRATKPALVAFMTMLNIRMGLWVPNPGRLEDKIGLDPKPAGANSRLAERKKRRFGRRNRTTSGGFTIEEVIARERLEIQHRWRLLPNGAERLERHELLGLAYSGGGIRSATLNLGITQALHEAGVFDHVDYMSSVSGGGYLASSISSAMRSHCPTRSDRDGVATLVRHPDGKQVLSIRKVTETADGQDEGGDDTESYEYSSYAELDPRVVDNQGKVKRGQRLLMLADPEVMAYEKSHGEAPKRRQRVSFGDMFGWRVRPSALLREIGGSLNEDSRAVNVSDGGHIENLATIELLRRRCKFIIVGDGEMDAKHRFKGLMVLLRTARVEEGIDIQITLDALRLGSGGHSHDERDHALPEESARRTARNWAIGKITYPNSDECGYLLYLKSSLTGNEGETILGYHAQYPEFPHQSTADQFFDEGQFESYRTLGFHIATQVLNESDEMNRHLNSDSKASFSEMEDWFEDLWLRFGESADAEVVSESSQSVD